MKLEEHKKNKEKNVNGWDWISTGLGIAGTLTICASLVQPKNPINIVRLPFGCLLFAGSVTAERLRESDLLSFERATEYEKNLLSDRIRRSTVADETIHEILEAEERFALLPPDRHGFLAARLGIDPPNYAARQSDPMVEAMSQPVSQSTAIEDTDPTGDFDPEQPQSKREVSGSTFIQAANVPKWFEQMGDRVPEGLLESWFQSPGIGIEIADGKALIVHGND